jgi:hypothetical protein
MAPGRRSVNLEERLTSAFDVSIKFNRYDDPDNGKLGMYGMAAEMKHLLWWPVMILGIGGAALDQATHSHWWVLLTLAGVGLACYIVRKNDHR